MGSKTLFWGPHCWKTLHALCALVERNRHEIPGLAQAMVRWLRTLPWVLPCVYCRRSAAKFFRLPRTRLSKKRTNFIRWAYYLHERVNMKLFWQDVKTSGALSAVQKWFAYQPLIHEFEAQARQDAPDDFTTNLWTHFFIFAGYVLTDWPYHSSREFGDEEERLDALYTFWHGLGDLLEILGSRYATVYAQALTSHGVPDEHMSLRDRMLWWERVQRVMGLRVARAHDWLPVCRAAMVGCDPDDTSKVGCY